ncbi:Transaldolase [Austwickia sp. TVS 96-490-7B]|uniref:transaldolase n=1 Tax=Austwickia sp. TVS 96-490-7B TaxID=2830843 RepID=UPI001C57F387|nr:transaldolase [Austwickia sp. TVS 96-490-7B]MBW3087036.1 Transaldolase [Austwickia sp. TVS 96-490-7B]
MTHARWEALTRAGVSLWLDDLDRSMLDTGELERLVSDRGVVGVTTNPTIFAAAVERSDAYASQLDRLAATGADPAAAVLEITTDDVRQACDVLRPVYDSTDGQDGRVSIEVDPRLARDTQGTIEAARHLWQVVDRPNVMIKIPATVEGLPAIIAVLGEGISVNVTLIFSLDRYRAVMNAFLTGMEQARLAGHDLSRIHSVASLFVSRIDAEIDSRLKALGTPEAQQLTGQAALANSRLAFHAHQETFTTPRWSCLASDGARAQRPLWASTGVKDPAYPDTMYVTELVTPGVVTTVPRATLEAIADHGECRGDTVQGTCEASAALLDDIERLGISYLEVMELLEQKGLDAFDASWAQLLDSVSAALRQVNA